MAVVESFINPDRIIAILGVIIALVAAVAAIYAAIYAKAAPSKDDFKRLEAHAAATSEHLERVHSNISQMDERQRNQHEHDALIARANSTSFMICGAADIGKPLYASITSTRDRTVVFNRIELLNESGNKFGSAQCQKTETPEQVIFVLDGDTVRNWVNSGTPVGNVAQDKTLYLRVYMCFKGFEEEVYRSVTVSQTTETRETPERGAGHYVHLYRIGCYV